MRRISAAMIAAARAEPRVAVMRPSSESSLSAASRRRTSLSVTGLDVDRAGVFALGLLETNGAEHDHAAVNAQASGGATRGRARVMSRMMYRTVRVRRV